MQETEARLLWNNVFHRKFLKVLYRFLVLIMLNATPALPDFEKILFFFCNRRFYWSCSWYGAVWYSVYSVQQRSRRGWPGAWCVVWHWRSPPSSSMFHSPSPRVTKIGSSVSNKKREKDFACLDCTIRQSLRTQHLAFHNLPFFHHFVKVTNIFISLIFHELSEFSWNLRVNWTKCL